MKTTLLAWMAAVAWAGLLAGCGHSHLGLVEVAEGSTGDDGGESSSGGSGGTGSSTVSGSKSATGGTSGTGTTGGSSSGTSVATSGSSSGATTGTGSTSGSSGGSSGSSSSGSTSAGCQSGAPDELAPCQANQDCNCPLSCVTGPLGQGLCERPCQSLSDCPVLYTTCQGGSCQPNLCGGLGGPPNGTLDGTCNVVSGNDGSCVPMLFGGSTVGLCYQGGAFEGRCDPSATRSNDPTGACAAAWVCLPAGAGNLGQCQLLCNPALPTSCPGAGPCVEPLGADPELGICEPGSSSGGTSSGGSSGGTSSSLGGSSGGSTSGGTSSGTSSTGGSSSSSGGSSSRGTVAELEGCQTTDNCGFPLECVYDALAGGEVCEYQCQASSDCPNLVTVCSQGVCHVNPCSAFDGTCNATGTNDGTCMPLTNDGGASQGYCYQGGSSDGTDCDPDGTRDDLSRVCPAGQMCYGGAVSFGGTCNAICDPQQGGPCPNNQFCSYIVNEPDLGICISDNGP
jgi:hypothetical protein